MPEKKYKLCYPQLGNYDIPIQYFVNNGLHLEYLAPPAMTKRTIELGAKYSPDFVCAPFKCMMGCYIEARDKGGKRFEHQHLRTHLDGDLLFRAAGGFEEAAV